MKTMKQNKKYNEVRCHITIAGYKQHEYQRITDNNDHNRQKLDNECCTRRDLNTNSYNIQ